MLLKRGAISVARMADRLCSRLQSGEDGFETYAKIPFLAYLSPGMKVALLSLHSLIHMSITTLAL